MSKSDAGRATMRLAVYGTLAPGRPNHHQLEGLDGCWRTGTVRGRLMAQGWGAELGFPGLVLDAAGDDIVVQLFESPALPNHWPRLDAFEGAGYKRVETEVMLDAEMVSASIYVLA